MSDCLDTLMCLHRAFRELEGMQFENVMGVGAFSLGHVAYWGLGASWHLEACVHCESFICRAPNVQKNASIVNFPCTPYSHIKTNSKTTKACFLTVCQRGSSSSFSTVPVSFLWWENGLKGKAWCQVLVTRQGEFAAFATKDLGSRICIRSEPASRWKLCSISRLLATLLLSWSLR